MGRQKGDGNRSKTRPSSSSLAASFLQTPASTTVGFGGYVGNSRVEAAPSLDQDGHVDVGGEVAVHLRRLSKKDPTTKLKALGRLGAFFKEQSANDLSQPLLQWIFEYKRLVQDDSHQVRQCTHEAMANLALTLGRGLAPHLRSVMGPWWVSQFDPFHEVAEAARRSFQVTFPGANKRVEALVFCSSDILLYIDEQLKLTPQTIADKFTPLEESLRKHELVISSSLLALASFVDIVLVTPTILSSSETMDVQDGASAVSDNTKQLTAKVCTGHKFFRDFTKSKSSQIRSASYHVLRAFVKNVPETFSVESLEIVSGIILGSFQEKDASCHPAMWDMILIFSQSFPSAWDAVPVRKAVLPRLWGFLRHGCSGSVQVSYPSLLPLLSTIPVHVIRPSAIFFGEFFNNLWQGHTSCSTVVKGGRALLNAIEECFLWIIGNSNRFADENFSMEHVKLSLIEEVLFKLLWKTFISAGNPASVVPSDAKVASVNGEEALKLSGEETNTSSRRVELPGHLVEGLKTSIIHILGALAAKDSAVLDIFWNSFQIDCVSIVGQEIQCEDKDLPRQIGWISRLSQFLSDLGSIPCSDDARKEWILNKAVRPLMKSLFPIIKSTEHMEALRFTSKIISIFGPTACSSINSDGEPCVPVAEIRPEVTKAGVKDNLNAVSGFLITDIIPWCLDGCEKSSIPKTEILLAFFEDGSLHQDWGHVLAYAMDFKSDMAKDHGKVKVLANLIKGVRGKFFQSYTVDDFLQRGGDAFGHWKLSNLDNIALMIVGSNDLIHPFCLELLRNLMGGFDQTSPPLISMDAVEQVLGKLLELILSALVHLSKDLGLDATLLLSSISSNSTFAQEEEDQALNLAKSALQTILHSFSCLYFVDPYSHVGAKILTSICYLHWAWNILYQSDVNAGSRSLGENYAESFLEDSLESVDDEVDGKNEGTELLLGSSAIESNVVKDVIAKLLKDVYARADANFFRSINIENRMSICGNLVKWIKLAVVHDYQNCADVISLSTKWLIDVMGRLCHSQDEMNQNLDLLLQPDIYWPLWTEFALGKDGYPPVIQKLVSNKLQEDHTRFVAFVDKVASVLGWNKVFGEAITDGSIDTSDKEDKPMYESASRPMPCIASSRIYILIELMCTWKWPGGSCMVSVIPFIQACARQAFGSCAREMAETVVISFLLASASILPQKNRAMIWATSDEEIEATNDPCLRASLMLLKGVFWAEIPWGREDALRLLSKLVPKEGQGMNRLWVLPYTLCIMAPILRRKEHLEEAESNRETELNNDSGAKEHLDFENMVCQWLHLALLSPPLSTCSSVQALSEADAWMNIAVSCFPLDPVMGFANSSRAYGKHITEEERNLLLALFRKQTGHEAVAGHRAFLAEQRAVSETRDEVVRWKRALETNLARLVATAAAYCWQEFGAEDWAFVLGEFRKWLEAAVVDTEEMVESIAASVKKSDENLLDISPQVLISEIQGIVNSPKCSEMELTRTAIAIYSMISDVQDFMSKEDSIALKDANWEKAKSRALEDVLRLFFASALAESIACDSKGGESAGGIIAMSRISSSSLWENISEITINAPLQAKRAAANSIDLWGIGRGAIQAVYSLLFSSYPLPSLQWASFCLLSTEPLQQLAISYIPIESEQKRQDEEEEDEEEAPNSVEGASYSELAKIRRELVAVLGAEENIILESQLTSSLRVRYLLAWAIFLARLQSLSGQLAASERLAEYIQDSNILTTLLECLFQHIPLKIPPGFSGGKRKTVSIMSAASPVAAAASKSASLGTASFAVETLFPVRTESMSVLAASLYGLVLRVLPASVRTWFSSLRDRSTASAIESFTTTFCSPQLLMEEFSQVQKSPIEDDSLTVKANLTTREVTAVYKKEEAALDMIIRLPSCYPLRAVEVDCTKRLGISETRLRKWMLSMAAFLRNQNGAVAGAIQIWKGNVDREFEGVEECPICYSIIHTINHNLPRLACKTCKHKFHSACLYKWFSTSHKSKCPLCQTPF